MRRSIVSVFPKWRRRYNDLRLPIFYVFPALPISTDSHQSSTCRDYKSFSKPFFPPNPSPSSPSHPCLPFAPTHTSAATSWTPLLSP